MRDACACSGDSDTNSGARLSCLAGEATGDFPEDITGNAGPRLPDPESSFCDGDLPGDLRAKPSVERWVVS